MYKDDTYLESIKNLKSEIQKSNNFNYKLGGEKMTFIQGLVVGMLIGGIIGVAKTYLVFRFRKGVF